MEMDVSVIIVNWNSKDYLKACIESIQGNTSEISYELIVIDGGSFDGSGEMLSKEYPEVSFIQSEKNVGFAKANNIAFAASRGKNVLFLNPDTEVLGPAVQVLHNSLDSIPGAGIVGARLLNSDRSVQATCVRAFPTILNQLLESDVLRKAFPRASLWGAAPLFSGDTAPSEVDAVSGACLMVRRSVFEEIGSFSEDYFMYSEDIDLCHKAHRFGTKIFYVPTAVAMHHGGGSSSKSSVNTFSSVMMLESRWRFFRKTRSSLYGLLYRVAMFVSSAARVGLAALVWPLFWVGGRPDRMASVMKKWGARLRWTLGGERWVRDI